MDWFIMNGNIIAAIGAFVLGYFVLNNRANNVDTTEGTPDPPVTTLPPPPSIRYIVNQLPKHPTKTYGSRSLGQIEQIVIHHSLTTSGSAAAYANFHINDNQWAGIGYHYVIDKDGTINQTQDLTTVSYHTAGQNTKSIGICLTGNYDTQLPPVAQQNAAIDLLRELALQFGKLPVQPHNHFSSKTCPGANIDTAFLQSEAYKNIA